MSQEIPLDLYFLTKAQETWFSLWPILHLMFLQIDILLS